MMINKWLIIFCMSCILLACDHQRVTRIGLIISSQSDTSISEIQSANQFLQDLSKTPPLLSFRKGGQGVRPIISEFIRLEDLKSRNSLYDFDILWLHFPDSLQTARIASDPDDLEMIRSYVHQGGNVLLTLEAARLINDLGFEDMPVQSQTVTLIDEGYGRKAGMHAFLEHPLFAGMNGGAFIFNPASDTVCSVYGFFGETVPSQGKVVAVDWAYIFLKEQNKLIMEYKPGKGNVLAIGAYTYFSPANANNDHLELFMRNAFTCLMNRSENSSVNYWNYDPQQVTEICRKTRTEAIPGISKWEITKNPITITLDSGSSDFWDIASSRVVVMGKETAGIDEIWAHPFMAFRDYEVGLRLSPGDSITWLSALTPGVEIDPSYLKRSYDLKQGHLYEIITVDPENPVAVVHYEWESHQTAALFIRCTSNFRLMWPYSEKAIHELRYGWDEGLEAMTIIDGSGRLIALMGSNKKPESWYTDQFEDINVQEKDLITTPTTEFHVKWMINYPMQAMDYLDIIFGASDEGEEKTKGYYHKALQAPETVYLRMSNHTRELFSQNLMISTPDNEFNQGYRWALAGTDRFFVNTPGIGGSLVAGYGTTQRGWDGGHRINGRPGYAWYFGRDGQWSGLALLDYGDFEKVRSILEVYQRFQGLDGKIYHELTTSGVVHYDASDATPLYIILAGRYLRHSGNIDFIRDNWSCIRKAIDFCFSTDTDGDQLIENTNVGHGWVEGGNLYGSHTSLYLASCWAQTLREAAYMAEKLGYKTEATAWLLESDSVINIINHDFWNPQTGFFHHGKYQDGSFLQEPTILSAIPLYFGQVSAEKKPSILEAIAGNGFTTDWGVRIISRENRLFNPRAYHSGTVWPLFTGWTALAEYNNGACIQGYTHIMNNMLVKKYWAKGFIEEVLNGLAFKPAGVCAHQCWSETMVLQPAIEGMLGLEVSAPDNYLKLCPRFPFHWDSVTVEHIRINDQWIDMKFSRNGSTVIYRLTKKGTTPVKIDFYPLMPPGWENIETAINGNGVVPDIHPQDQGVVLQLPVHLIDTCRIEIRGKKGISILPYIPDPHPGDTSEGIRIISATLINDHYNVTVEGPAGKSGLFYFYAAEDQNISPESADYLEKIPEGYKIRINFEPSEKAYITKEFSLVLH